MHGLGTTSDWTRTLQPQGAVAENSPIQRSPVDRTGEPPPAPLGLVRS